MNVKATIRIAIDCTWLLMFDETELLKIEVGEQMIVTRSMVFTVGFLPEGLMHYRLGWLAGSIHEDTFLIGIGFESGLQMCVIASLFSDIGRLYY